MILITITNNKMEQKDIYKFSYDYLIKISDGFVSKADVDLFISTQDASNCASLADAFSMLINILQDFQMYPNVIKFRLRENDIKEAIHFPDLDYCSKFNPDELADYFINKYNSNRNDLYEWIQNYDRG